MSDKGQSPQDKKNLYILLVVLAVALVIGVYVYKQKNQEKTASLKIGDKEISATISQ